MKPKELIHHVYDNFSFPEATCGNKKASHFSIIIHKITCKKCKKIITKKQKI